MNKRKLGVAVSAMILAVHLGNPLAADPSLEQLTEIVTILTDNDVAALCDYLEANPELLEGEAPLAVLLRQFQQESRDLTACLSIEPNLRDALLRNRSLPQVEEEGSDSGEEEPLPGDEPDPDPDDGPDAPPGRDPDPAPEPDPSEEPDPDPTDGGIY